MINFNSLYEIDALEDNSNYYVYHYAPKRLQTLMTIQQQLEFLKREEIDPVLLRRKEKRDSIAVNSGNLPYSKSVSLFFDVPPFQLMLKNFPANHHHWRRGNVLFEYTIDVRTLGDIPFKTFDTPLDLFLYDYFYRESNETYKKFFYKMHHLLRNATGNAGRDQETLINTVKKYKGKTKEAYIKVFSSKEFANPKLKYYYAPRVPHLLVYPSKPIEPIHVREIRL